MSNTSNIIDYDERDFVQYWESRSKGLLHESESRIIRDLLPKQRQWFLDLGCGFGRLMPTYQSDDQHAVLVDYSLKQLRIAADRKSHEHVHLIAADACNLPFRDEVFDSGICIRLLHHIDAPQHLMNEIFRILSARSCFLFNYMNRRSLLRILRYGTDSFRHTHERISEVIFATHPAYYSEVTREAGFTIESTRGTGLMHQILHANKRMDRCVNEHQALQKLIAMIERLADPLLGKSQLALMQYTRLEKKTREPALYSGDPEWNLFDILRCPACRSNGLSRTNGAIVCPGCKHSFNVENGIYDLRC